MNLLMIVLVVLAIWRGWRGMKRGFAGEVHRLLTLLISLFVLSLGILLYTSIKEKNTGNIVLSVIFLLVTGLIARLVSLIMKSIDALAKLPVISFFNALLGLLIGIAEVIVALWIVYVIITSFDTGIFGQQIMAWTQENSLLQKLYTWNQIAYWMAGL